MLHLLHVNAVGVAILVFGFGGAYGIAWLAGLDHANGKLLAIAGVLVAALDFAVRLGGEDGHWLYPRRGGMFFLIPVWIFGLFWFFLGIYRVLAG